MQFFKNFLSLAALASIVLAGDNTVTFVSQDGTNRSIVFTPQAGKDSIDTLSLGGYESKTVTFPYQWIGNFFAMETDGGDANEFGMLGEFTWNTWEDLTFFDVSAIVNPNDVNGVKEIFPQSANTPLAGCQEFPCTNVYNVYDDNAATKSSTETDFVCLIGTLETQRRRGALAAAEKMKRVAPRAGEALAKQ